MSQKSEKYARRLRADMDELQRRQMESDAFLHFLREVQEEQAHEEDKRRRRHREELRAAERDARQWKTMTYAALVTAILVLIAAIMAVQADAEEPAVMKPSAEPTVQTIPLPDKPEQPENELIQAALLEKASVIENCEVTWYTEATCGKTPDDPAYGITKSGLPVVEHLTCAVDPKVIPLYSDVFVEYADGTIEQLWATDTGVYGNSLDIYTPDYDYAMECGRQWLTVYWIAPLEVN